MPDEQLPATQPELKPELDPYALLGKPPKELSREEMLAICEHLRASRQRYLQGTPDKPKRTSAAPKVDKAAATAALLEEL